MRLWAWLATRAASGWLIAILLAVSGSAAFYIQGLRVDAARCKGRQDVQQQIDELTNRVVRNVEKTADENIRAIRQTPDECAGADVPDAILDSLRRKPDQD